MLKTIPATEDRLGAWNAEFTPLHKQATWDNSKDGRQVQIAYKEAITFSSVQSASMCNEHADPPSKARVNGVFPSCANKGFAQSWVLSLSVIMRSKRNSLCVSPSCVFSLSPLERLEVVLFLFEIELVA